MGRSSRKVGKVTSGVLSAIIKLIVYILILLILVRGGIFAYRFGYDIFYAQAMDKPENAKEVTVRIPEGSDAAQAADILMDAGLIDNKISFIIQARFFELKINPGEYTFSTSETSRKMLEVLDDGVTKEE